ncbi:MAG: FGGY family carbohydrate kinase [Pseudomonadota bacterium]
MSRNKVTTTLHLSLEQTGTCCRASVFDNRGQLRALAEQSVHTFRGREQRVEHDPLELVQALIGVTHEACKQVGKQASIRNAGLATQRSSIVCWDRVTGEPLSNVISWQDRRATEQVAKLGKYQNLIRSKTGLVLSPHYGMGKLNWCLNNLSAVSDSLARGRLAFGPLASYLVSQLVKEKPLVVDPVNASRTLLLDLATLDWSEPLLDLFKIPEKALPKIVPTGHDYGILASTNQPIPLSVVTGEQSASMFSLGSPEPDIIYINLDSGAFIRQLSPRNPQIVEGLLTSILAKKQSDILYAIEGTVNGAGSALSIVADELDVDGNLLGENLGQWMTDCKQPPLFLNGVAGLGSPYWRPEFKSEMVGHGDKYAQLVAVAESIVFLIHRNIQTMSRRLEMPRKLVVTGDSAYPGICQKLANLSKIRVEKPKMQHGAARGLAFLCSESENWLPLGPATGYPVEEDVELCQRYSLWRQLVRAKLD